MNKLIPYGKLSKREKAKIRKALALGLLEVNCPWWNKNHWEFKSPTTTKGHPAEPWEECFYRIKAL